MRKYNKIIKFKNDVVITTYRQMSVKKTLQGQTFAQLQTNALQQLPYTKMCRKVKFNDIYDKQRLFENAKKIVQKPAQSSPKPQKNMTEIVVVSLPNLNRSHVQNNASSSIYHEQTFVSINF